MGHEVGLLSSIAWSHRREMDDSFTVMTCLAEVPAGPEESSVGLGGEEDTWIDQL